MTSIVEDVKREVFTYTNLVHAVSGMTGGVIAISTFYPLNIIRIRLQVDENMKAQSALSVAQKIIDESGVGALYQGWWSSVVSLGASNFVYFYTYNAFKTVYKKLIAKNDKINIDPITNLVIASTAGVINVLATTPLWVAGTRLSVQSKKADPTEKPYAGVADCLKRIVSEEGIAALWKGVGPSLILVSNPSIQFVTYERLRAPMAKLAEKRGSPITALEFFIMGAIAKAVATILTYPLQLAQSRLRADKGKAGNKKERNYKGTADVLQKIVAEQGVKGVFKGMEAKLWQTVLTAAFQFLTYEQVQKIVFKLLANGEGPTAAH
mmetsp:Transcript_9487/g.16617  ORF Transcript_9487/g.16617 Transcript_9487/m.16617 type:complete len:323 (+) Transcript_9487:54-1022(+)|eukprot:CAMPEP_0184508170 /NCGR_PEP_ID=MMETSP0198_2-20121128/620_1 /TAXON_ID=1112570 /ORGANISM="Thraustochytrium sp., Strain LLF1b" /LENGTH=322 /DNA_ID=CAMNT_0026897941 /DNA_START=134 /DNA_END=1102 /DNA_ORIENTATION=+